MKTITNTLIKITLVIFILISGPQMFANDFAKKKKQTQDNTSYNVYKGVLKDKESNDPLVFATIAVEGENTATVSNSDGEFILKISKNSEVKNIIISHLGYENLIVPIRDLKSNRNVLKIKPAILTLAEVVVFP
ncbi:MAG: carboxypeptidase-like regulatory domain-containing protein, partial [Bacteroidetes bacterium]|nr:carboxypeptidase-like regulatory domain-containing protein [Bacteroidota bacterium]